MEGFTLTLALVDAVPVVCFGASMILVAVKFRNPLFILGAVLSTLAGCCKVAWKLILGLWKKDVAWLNRLFLPMQITGFGFLLGSFLVSAGKIPWGAVLTAVTGFPSVLFFLAWLGLMGFMGWYRKNRFQRNDAKTNWTAQAVNCLGQTCLLLGILLAG